MKNLVIDKQVLKENIGIIKKQAAGVPIYAVLTGDACGAGLVEAARMLREDGIVRFAVAEPSDAALLRESGFSDEEILMLRSTTDREEIEQLIDLNVVCTIGSYESGLALNGIAESRSTVAEAHVQVDTGMGYGGFLVSDTDKIISLYRYLPNVAISGIYTQIHSGGKEKCNAEQLDRFMSVVNLLRKEGFETGITHAAGSAALFTSPSLLLDAVRVGSAFFGRTNLPAKKTGLKQAASVEVSVGDVRWVPKGHTVGNELLVTMKKPTKAAVIPVGYFNGISAGVTRDPGLFAALRRWRAERKVSVKIGSSRVRVIGRVGMLETIVDVTDIECIPGDIAVFSIDPIYARGLTRVYR
jgi:alanine racemase